jgi:two-component system, OmpR family, sensor kinase
VRWLRSLSLRTRLVISTVALLAIVLVSLGLLVNAILASRLHSDLRQRLVERAGFAAVLSERGLTGQQLADSLTGQGITGSVIASDGETFVGRDQPRPSPPGDHSGRPPTRPSTPATVAPTITQSGDEVSATVNLAGSRLLLTTSSGDIERTLSLLKTTELAAGAAFLLIAGLLSLAVVRGALGPLHKMGALADRIRGGDRGLRLRPARPQTDIGRTAAAIDAMLDSLEAAEADAQSAEVRMRQFLADASHDLRTPLAVMSAAAEELLRTDPARSDRERLLVELIREGRRAGRLVDDLVLMARLDDADPSSALLTDDVELVALVASNVEHARLVMRDRVIELDRPATEVWVRGDGDRIKRAITNLLDNARNATAAGGRIRVTVHPAPGTSAALIEVRDDGPGLPPGEHERVFDRFVRLGERRGAADGTGEGAGLGLPIARAIARAHGGDLISVPARTGAHFALTLPAFGGIPSPAVGGPPKAVDGRREGSATEVLSGA